MATPKISTTGLTDAQLKPFADDADLAAARAAAKKRIEELKAAYPKYFEMDELAAVRAVSAGFESFYKAETQTPYIAAASKGPWVVTIHGAVVHDSGGYGMLGFGHNPKAILDAMSEEQTMANIMAPSFAQGDFSQALLKEFSHNRGAPVYKRFMCMNSGSEGVELSLRISDAHAKQHGGGKPACVISMGDGFHGRTYRAATISSSCRAKYLETLQSFGKCQRAVRFVEWNAVDELDAVFSKAVADGFHIECMICEPVQGEGLAGLALSPEFYRKARELTLAHNTLLIVDSVQAAGRAYGTLSFLNAEAFAKLPGADIEVFSKALNAGQYPLSLLALGERAEGVYAIGTYGNTMTSNPRALQVGKAVLAMMTDDVRKNIVASGAELIAALEGLCAKYPGVCTHVTGTGLMSCLHIDKHFPVVCAEGGLETELRQAGIHFVHGGDNGVRLTPHFNLTSAEIQLIVVVIEASVAKRAALNGGANSTNGTKRKHDAVV